MLLLPTVNPYEQGLTTMNYFKELTSEGPIKFLSCIFMAMGSWVLGSFAPIWTVLLIVTILVFTDAFLGCKVARSKGLKCEARRFQRTLKKLVWCTALIWFANRIDVDILVSFNAHLVEIFAGVISGVELWSMLENLNTLFPNGPWKILSKVLRTKGEKYLDITIDKEDYPHVKKLVKKIK